MMAAISLAALRAPTVSISQAVLSLLDGDPRLGHLALDHAVLSERAAERDAAARPIDHQGQRAFGHPDQAHAVVHPPRPETGLSDGEPVTFVSEEVRRRHAHVAEDDFAMAVLVVVAEHR